MACMSTIYANDRFCESAVDWLGVEPNDGHLVTNLRHDLCTVNMYNGTFGCMRRTNQLESPTFIK